MSSYIEALGLDLAATSKQGNARNQILMDARWQPTPTTNVSYVASNRVLIIADQNLGDSIRQRLSTPLEPYLIVPSDTTKRLEEDRCWSGAELLLSGYLGRFRVQLNGSDEGDEDQNLGVLMGIQNGFFDQVIDCGTEPLISASVKPPGYYHVAKDESLIEETLSQLSEMIGEFEKPRFFDYNPSICAHGRSGITGCNRCLEACPTDAIISIGESIEVNPHLCQGGGSCTASCPSGVISYRYPKAEEQIEFLRTLIRDLRATSPGTPLAVLFYDTEHGQEILAPEQQSIPDHTIPFVVEEIGSIGLDLLASALAYGASRVDLLVPAAVSAEPRNSIHRDINLLVSVFQQLDLKQFQINAIASPSEAFGQLDTDLWLDDVASYAGIGGKRNLIRQAMQYFSSLSDNDAPHVGLPEKSIFGQVALDTLACTLCMGCVSVCPGSALEAGGETPALKFIEANCLQCGICATACPESALGLEPRFLFDTASANKARVLKEEEPFRCIKCNKAFATQGMINRMTEKLAGHWMFETADSINRLKMCENCRVADMYDRKEMI